jgi:hypothetical protein
LLLLANLTLTAQSQFANTPNTFALFGNPKSDKEPKKDCLFATNRVTDVDIDANFKPFKLPFNVKKRRTPLHVLRLFTLFFFKKERYYYNIP